MFGNGQLVNDWFLQSLSNEKYLKLNDQIKEEQDKQDFNEIMKYVKNTSDIFSSPFDDEEINIFENDNNIKLPKQLRNYLTGISKNLYIAKFNQNKKSDIVLENKENLSFKCNLEKNIYSERELYKLDNSIVNSIEKGDGTMFLRDIGCGYTDFIVLNGKYRGTVWSEELCGGGAVRMINTTFYKYVLDNLERKIDI